MSEKIDLSGLQTEAINPRTTHIDQVSTLRMCTIINREDHLVSASVTPCLPIIAQAIDALVPRVRQGGRVVYVGAGTSGRLGVLDASEIPPTFAAPFSQFVGLIAGGDAAIRQAQEGAEDSVESGEQDLEHLHLDPKLDSLIGIAASGRTPYVLGCLAYAKRRGCVTVGVACAEPSAMSLSGQVDFMISPLPGPEVVTGSTRLKAGTATKLVLNMLSTGTMIRVGKTYGNMMVDVVASNLKLKQRSRNILRKLSPRCASMDDVALDDLLGRCNRSVKLALIVSETGLPVEQCRQRLAAAGGVLAKALAEYAATPVKNDLSNGTPPPGEYVLCIDGGGSKCAAAIADRATGLVVSRGIAGPSNLTDRGIEEVAKTIISAADQAVQNLRLERHAAVGDISFSSVWVGAAGVDRPGYRERLTEALSHRWGGVQHQLRVTNDVDLLAAAMRRRDDVKSGIVVIAGTGSVSMRYSCDGEDVVRLARSGGWGHLLGDEGGGYTLGREAIQRCLSSVEDRRLGLLDRQPALPSTPLEREILAYFGFESSESAIDLLSEVVAAQSDRSVKSRIAGAAQIVLGLAAASDPSATEIVSTQITHLVDTTLGRILDPRCQGYTPSAETVLILSGGLMLHETYQSLFRTALRERGINFKHVETVTDVATNGAQFLAAAK